MMLLSSSFSWWIFVWWGGWWVHSIDAFLFVPPLSYSTGPLFEQQTDQVYLKAPPIPTTTTITTTPLTPDDVIHAVKLFGRFAETYLVGDSSTTTGNGGGGCCYSGCSDCEHRLPNGDYEWSEQSAVRPKWIPIYEERLKPNRGSKTKNSRSSNGRSKKDEDPTLLFHGSIWFQHCFTIQEDTSSLLEDCPNSNRVKLRKPATLDWPTAWNIWSNMEYQPPLGAPVSVSKQKAERLDPNVTYRLFLLLQDPRRQLITRRSMQQGWTNMVLVENGPGVTFSKFWGALQSVR